MSAPSSTGPLGPSAADLTGDPGNLADSGALHRTASGASPLVWSPVKRPSHAAANWPLWLASGRHLDPYLVWADLTRYAGFGGLEPHRAEHGGKLAVLLEVKFPEEGQGVKLKATSATSRTASCDDLGVALSCLEIPGLYTTTSNGITELRRNFFTARVLPGSLEQLLRCPDVIRLQLGVPRIPSTDISAPTRDTEFSDPNRVARTVIGIIDDGCAFAHPTFCNLVGETRVHYLWDQDAVSSSCESTIEGMGYGREFRHEQLNAATRQSFAGNDPLRAYVHLDYAPTRLNLHQRSTSFTQRDGGVRLPDQAMRPGAHGTGVMYMAAGVSEDARRRSPLDDQRAVAPEVLATMQLRPEASAEVKDHASAWPIVFVQLPTRTTLDTSGGSLGVHVLDGLHYLIDRASRIAYDEIGSYDGAVDHEIFNSEGKRVDFFPGNKLIVNISYGALGGSHDGTSIAEMAIADVVYRPRKIVAVWVCLAAGNGHAARAQARATLRADDKASFLWSVGPDNPLESFLEIWLPEVDVYGVALPPGAHERFRISVWPPGFEGMCQVACGQGVLGHRVSDPGAPAAGIVYSRRVAQGLRGTMVLVAVARTRPNAIGETSPGGVGLHGQWRVDVEYMDASDERPVDVHAWTERNDLLFGNLRAQQSKVAAEVPIPEPTEFTPQARALLNNTQAAGLAWVGDPLQPRYTMSSLAGLTGPERRDRTPDSGAFYTNSTARNGGRLVVAGAYRMADSEIAPYSSGGPSRHVNPRHQQTGRKAEPHPVYKDVNARPRAGVDVVAPADVGTALRGLRVAGTRPGQWVRFSGTSLAAPSAARVIANEQHVNNVRQRDPMTPLQAQRARPDSSTCSPAAEQRATLTPLADDLFRRGPWRVW